MNCTSQCYEACTSVCDRMPFPGRPDDAYMYKSVLALYIPDVSQAVAALL